MQVGMIGLGRMGAGLARRLMRSGHQCVVYDRDQQAVKGLAKEGAAGSASLDDLVTRLTPPPRTIWVMVPATAVDGVVSDLAPRLATNDVVIDGGNSY
jgi:6-phosphogluconate dehydrogenase